MSARYYILLFFLLPLQSRSVAFNQPPQSILYESSLVHVFTIGRSENVNAKNLMVWEIARANYFIPYQTRYSISYQLKIRADFYDDHHGNISITLNTDQVYGDRTYKEFDLSRLLIPPLFELTLRLSLSDSLSMDYRSGRLSTQQEYSERINLPSAANQPRITLTNIEFYYDSASIRHFRNYLSLIHDYLAYFELLDFTLIRTQSANPEIISDPLVTHFTIYNLEEALRKINSYQPPPGLIVPEKFTRDRNDRIRTLQAEVRRLRTIFDRTLNSQPYRLSEEDYQKAALTIIRSQYEYLRVAQSIPYFYQPLFHQMAVGWNQPDDWLRLVSSLTRQFTRIDSLLMVNNLTNQLWKEYQNHFQDLLNTGKFNELLILLEPAEIICFHQEKNDCRMPLFRMKAAAALGMYESYLKIADNALRSGNFLLAKNYLNRALEYQKKNSAVILVPDAALSLMEQLAWKSFQSGREAARNHQVKKASEHLQLALELYDQLGIGQYRDLIVRELSSLNPDLSEPDSPVEENP